LPRKPRKDPDHFTLLIVPHTDQPPISLCLPHGAVYVALLLVVGLVSAFLLLVNDYRSTQAQLQAALQLRQADAERQQAMRDTILAQDVQVRSLTSETDRLNGDLLSVDHLVSDIRRIVGLDRLTPTPAVSPTITPTALPAAPPTSSDDRAVAMVGGYASGGARAVAPAEEQRAASVLSSRGDAGRGGAAPVALAELQAAVSERILLLRQLREAAIARVEKVDAGSRGDPASIQSQLVLYDAAPKGWPLEGPLNVTSVYGWRIDPVSPWLLSFHEGIDLSAWYSTPVYATKDGRVIYAGWDGDFGWTVEIQHEMGYVTRYGHNRADLCVWAGEVVKSGQLIAYVSDTGRTTGPHVHYEIVLNGVKLDPMKFLILPGGSSVQP
jgi:murein DD-endopeptidase MepM/ murein hydrolase activator NlpD